MSTSVISSTTFFDSLFSTEEYNFIKGIDSDTHKFGSSLDKEFKYRNSIISFINALVERLLKGENVKEDKSLSNLLELSQECFDRVDENIKFIQTNKEQSENINIQFNELLKNVKLHENTMLDSDFYDRVSDLKKKINSVMEEIKNSKLTIKDNDSFISNFLRRNSVKKIINSFSSTNSTELISQTKLSNIKEKDNIKKESSLEIPKGVKENSNKLLVSEKDKTVYLPYSKEEVIEYLSQYPEQYFSFDDVINQEFIIPIDKFIRRPVVARFRETYSLIRDRECKSIIDALKFAMETMFIHDLNPAVIAACKTQTQLEHYMQCLESNHLDEFTDFEIVFDVNPLKV